jgi:hypothetical protein
MASRISSASPSRFARRRSIVRSKRLPFRAFVALPFAVGSSTYERPSSG